MWCLGEVGNLVWSLIFSVLRVINKSTHTHTHPPDISRLRAGHLEREIFY